MGKELGCPPAVQCVATALFYCGSSCGLVAATAQLSLFTHVGQYLLCCAVTTAATNKSSVAENNQALYLSNITGPFQVCWGRFWTALPPGPGLTEQLLVEHLKAAAAQREPWGCLTPAITWAGSELMGHFHEQIIGQNTSYSFTQCPRGPGSAVCWQRGAWKIGANISIHCHGVLLGRE